MNDVFDDPEIAGKRHYNLVDLNSDDHDYILRNLLQIMYEIRNSGEAIKARDVLYGKKGGNNWNGNRSGLLSGMNSGRWGGSGVLFDERVSWIVRPSHRGYNEWYDDVEYRTETYKEDSYWSLNIVTGNSRTSRVTLQFGSKESLLKAYKYVYGD